MRDFYVLRMYNFFYFSLLSVFIAFIPVYLRSQQISNTKIGMMIGVGAFIGILSQPFWGIVSDKQRTIKKIILTMMGISLIAGIILFQSTSFALLSFLVGLMYFFFLPMDSLSESLNVQMSVKWNVSYGQIRMFGALGFAITSLVVGVAANQWGEASFAYVFSVCGLVTFLLIVLLPEAPTASKSVSFQSLVRFFTYPKTVWFFLLILITAIPHRMNDNFIGIYIQSSGGTTGMVGQAWFMMAVSELLFFALSSRWVKPGREIYMISIASFFYTIRFLLCALIRDPQWLIYLQLFQGITFVFFYVASIQFLNTIIPEEWRSTGQTALAVVFFGISGILGSFIGGLILDRWGGSYLYFMMSGTAFIALLANLVLKGRLKPDPQLNTKSTGL